MSETKWKSRFWSRGQGIATWAVDMDEAEERLDAADQLLIEALDRLLRLGSEDTGRDPTTEAIRRYLKRRKVLPPELAKHP